MVHAAAILFVASPVAPLGHSAAGGVSAVIKNSARTLVDQGYRVQIAAPRDSRLEDPALDALLIPVDGELQPTEARMGASEIYPILAEGMTGALWRYARARQQDFDLILNFGHDWLPFYLTAFFTVPVAHLVNLADVNRATSAEIRRIARNFPAHVAFLSRAQALDLGIAEPPFLLPPGLELADYDFSAAPAGGLVWAGRITPEKGLRDSLAIARSLGETLHIAGTVHDAAYWDELRGDYGALIDYRGPLGPQAFHRFLGEGRVLLQTQDWHEAFGLITIEAMACGTPVVAYDRGANSEIVVNGVNGFVVAHGDRTAAAEAVAKCAQLDRRRCRDYVEQTYSLNAYGGRLACWIDNILVRTYSGTTKK